MCVCSFCATHPGIDVNVRGAFWQELAATVDLPMVIAGDANVWHPSTRQSDPRGWGGARTPLSVQDRVPSPDICG